MVGESTPCGNQQVQIGGQQQGQMVSEKLLKELPFGRCQRHMPILARFHNCRRLILKGHIHSRRYSPDPATQSKLPKEQQKLHKKIQMQSSNLPCAKYFNILTT
ncbi:uncharacterized protein DMAD_11125 [Drosophila madeirensis]|uniref:Uncharacterized protein n=1 Tax=Drosophila madeirensis TaxID=30013 RepID=A0AAU9FBX7_DROMD